MYYFVVFNDLDVGYFVVFEKFGNGFVGGIVREVVEMSSIRRFVGEFLWNGFVDRIV